MDLQKFVNTLSDHAQTVRSNYHLTLGELIKALKEFPAECPVECDEGSHPGSLSSYRGYYCDLAIEPSHHLVTCAELLERCRLALGNEFEGYKGGEYTMTEKTPLWLSHYGTNSEVAIIGVRDGGKAVILVTKQLSDF